MVVVVTAQYHRRRRHQLATTKPIAMLMNPEALLKMLLKVNTCTKWQLVSNLHNLKYYAMSCSTYQLKFQYFLCPWTRQYLFTFLFQEKGNGQTENYFHNCLTVCKMSAR